MSPSLLQTDHLAKWGAEVGVEKHRAVIAIKRIGAQIGLKAADMMLLDTLAAFSQPQDWDAGRRPIVWPSNTYLMEQTGFSLSSLKRHVRRLAEAGAIAFEDSPNGKRWGRRNADGAIVEAYGFDLSPLAARAEAFEQLYAELQIERALSRQLKREITVRRRMIRARIDAALSGAFTGPWGLLARRFENLLAHLPHRKKGSEQLRQLLDQFEDFLTQVEEAFEAENEPADAVENASRYDLRGPTSNTEMDPREAVSEPHIPTTNQLQSSSCNDLEEVEAMRDTLPAGYVALPSKRPVSNPTKLEPPLVLQACPEFTSWAHNLQGHIRNWNDLHRVAGQLRPMIGVSEETWDKAQKQLGKQTATAALALVFEKHGAGQVKSPGGYLRGMMRKAGAGALYLERSFFGRLNGAAV